MDRIPIYDETAPIACTAGSQELSQRRDQIERLRAALEHVDRTADGLLLHFPNRDDIADELRRFTVDEKACCQFWGFDVAVADDRLTLRWDGPPSVDAFFGDLLEYFRGDRPIAELPGLL